MVAQKLDSDYRYDSLVKERKKFIEMSIYDCDECVYEATTLFDLQDHKKSNHDQPNFKCDDCGHIVLTETNLKGPKQTYHEEPRTGSVNGNVQLVFLCDECESEFLTKAELEATSRKNIERLKILHVISVYIEQFKN